jgi:hypothetical protein
MMAQALPFVVDRDLNKGEPEKRGEPAAAGAVRSLSKKDCLAVCREAAFKKVNSDVRPPTRRTAVFRSSMIHEKKAISGGVAAKRHSKK